MYIGPWQEYQLARAAHGLLRKSPSSGRRNHGTTTKHQQRRRKENGGGNEEKARVVKSMPPEQQDRVEARQGDREEDEEICRTPPWSSSGLNDRGEEKKPKMFIENKARRKGGRPNGLGQKEVGITVQTVEKLFFEWQDLMDQKNQRLSSEDKLEFFKRFANEIARNTRPRQRTTIKQGHRKKKAIPKALTEVEKRKQAYMSLKVSEQQRQNEGQKTNPKLENQSKPESQPVQRASILPSRPTVRFDFSADDELLAGNKSSGIDNSANLKSTEHCDHLGLGSIMPETNPEHDDQSMGLESLQAVIDTLDQMKEPTSQSILETTNGLELEEDVDELLRWSNNLGEIDDESIFAD